jgi:hypothetical protein
MANSSYRLLTRAALLLALTLLFQSLRFVLPLPVFFSTFVIGTLVNACLLIAAETIGLRAALMIGVIAPVVAYLQQLLPLPVFVPPVAVGNIAYVTLFLAVLRWNRWFGIAIASLGKTLFLYSVFAWMLTWIAIPSQLATGLLFVMSWPQFITTIAGGLLATAVSRRIRSLL